jgi:hypothetical protein
MVVDRVADAVLRGVEGVTGSVSEAFFEPTIRLGVTGLSRAGKTVFITSLVANLLERGRMTGFSPRIETAFLQPQPNDTVARFDYEAHLAALTGATPHWPEGTRAVSELRVSLKVRPGGLLGGFKGPRTVHLDIVDYPGEWLLDLALLDLDYAAWSGRTLARLEAWGAADTLRELRAVDSASPHAEPTAKVLAEAYTGALHAARAQGAYDCTPGRFLLPGDLAGSPALTFVPLPDAANARGSLGREMARRYEAYKTGVVKPFFRDHFARLDRQIILIDVLGAVHGGPRALEELRQAMADLLGAFKPGRTAFLSRLFGARRVDRVLFAATKADHLHHTQHGALSALTSAMVQEARTRADFAGAKTHALSIAALRTTTEEVRTHAGTELGVVRGRLEDSGKEAAFYPGALPESPDVLLNPARAGAETWLDADYEVMRFQPAPNTLRPGMGPPHIRLDRAAEFLLADRLR